jgi:hypothetical protein
VRKCSSYSILTSALDGMSGQRHAPAALYSQERTSGSHWIGGWVDLTAGLDTNKRKNPLPLSGVKSVDWIEMALDRGQMNTVTNLRIP